MGVAAPGEEDFRQRNDRNILLTGGLQVIQRTRPGRQNPGSPINLFQSEGSRPGEDKSVWGAPKGIIRRILAQSPREIRLRTQVTCSGETVKGKVLSLGAFQ